jgi:replicative superfamily II helicase
MVDFDKLRNSVKKSKPIEPTEIFRRLPKTAGINDLYTSQASVLKEWFKRRADKDIVVKLHTGGGKTLVGLLMAQSILNETSEPVLYLTPTVQLVNQTLEKAKAYGINAVPYVRGATLNEEFLNGSAIMVATYKALFHGKSKFGIRGDSQPVKVAAVVLDDAHAAFSAVRDAFTLNIDAKRAEDLYENITDLFRRSFKDIDKSGSFDDIISGKDFGVLEVPYWAWREKLDVVRELLKSNTENFELVWPFLRDNLHLCHALVSRSAFTITPILPLVNALPTFYDAQHRIYMSATIADDSEIVRTFDASPKAVSEALTSRSLAGISERMILIPDLMPFQFDVRATVKNLLKRTAAGKRGAIVLVSSDKTAQSWLDIASLPADSKEVEQLVVELQEGNIFGPVVFANRYDGIDLPGNSCRLLVMEGLPSGTADYELFKASALYGGSTITRMLAQRIEQGIGRGARGAGDHCVVLLIGGGLAAWIAKEANFRFLTSATRAQLEMGSTISKSIEDSKDLIATIKKSYIRDKGWTEYHAETLAELVDEESSETDLFELAAAERKALNLWQDGNYEKAITKLEKAIESTSPDPQTTGWLKQFAARIADSWEHGDKAEELQRQAFSANRNLLRPKVLPPYRPLPTPSIQAKAIINQVLEYRPRRGYLRAFDEVVSFLHKEASANQFEQALADLGRMIGLTTARHDDNGQGPDVLWLLPSKTGFIIEAKSRKKDTAALKKEDHGQLLVAQEWFDKYYKGYACIRVSVHPQSIATKAASAHASHALTYEKLALLVSDARAFLARLCDSQLDGENLIAECAALLKKAPIREDQLVKGYLLPFTEKE